MNIVELLLSSTEVEEKQQTRLDAGKFGKMMRRSDLRRDVESVAHGLRRLGFQTGDCLAIWAETRYEWLVAEMAAMLAGGVVVGIDPSAHSDSAEFIIQHSQATALIAGANQRPRELSRQVHSSLKYVVGFDRPGDSEDQLKWNQLLSEGRGRQWEFELPSENSPATIIYTSGTTGQPKAIEYTHQQLTVAWQAISQAFPQLTPGDTTICWLPMCHLFQRMMNYVALALDLKIAFVDDPFQLMQAIKQVRPNVIIGVPRFYEKLHREMVLGIDRQPAIISYAINSAMRLKQKRNAFGEIAHSFMDRLLLGRLRNVLGGRVKFMVTGSAPTPLPVLEFFDSIGIPLLEAYGLSENSIPIAANLPNRYRFGSVGQPFSETTIRLAEDNEILIKGPGVFRGYFGDKPSDDRVRPDGFLPTGDIGYFDDDGFLYLTGRKSEMIKTSTGRRIAPGSIEAVYSQSSFVEHVVVVGDRQKHLAALVTLSADASREDDLLIQEKIQDDFDRLGAELPPYARVHRFAILPRPLSVSEGELTASLKIRRAEIADKYSNLIEGLFDEREESLTASASEV